LREDRDPILPQRITFVARHEHADAPHPLGLLSPRYRRTRCCTSQSCDELSQCQVIAC
jgi:hypothetical protein